MSATLDLAACSLDLAQRVPGERAGLLPVVVLALDNALRAAGYALHITSPEWRGRAAQLLTEHAPALVLPSRGEIRQASRWLREHGIVEAVTV